MLWAQNSGIRVNIRLRYTKNQAGNKPEKINILMYLFPTHIPNLIWGRILKKEISLLCPVLYVFLIWV